MAVSTVHFVADGLESFKLHIAALQLPLVVLLEHQCAHEPHDPRSRGRWVDAAIREANGGMGVAKTGGGVFDHVSSVQRGVNSINKTLDHITTMEGKYANSPSDMQALQTTKAAYEAIKEAVRQQFQKAGAESAVKW